MVSEVLVMFVVEREDSDKKIDACVVCAIWRLRMSKCRYKPGTNMYGIYQRGYLSAKRGDSRAECPYLDFRVDGRVTFRRAFRRAWCAGWDDYVEEHGGVGGVTAQVTEVPTKTVNGDNIQDN